MQETIRTNKGSPLHKLVMGPLQSCISGQESKKDNHFVDASGDGEIDSITPSRSPTVLDSPCDQSLASNAEFPGKVRSPGAYELAIQIPQIVEANSSTENVPEPSVGSETTDDLDFESKKEKAFSFLLFRMSYLFVTLVIMLADGLQGTHLYVLYEGYGFSVASLYCLGFFTGAVTAPITGPMIDKFGRKRSALLYCALEVGINLLEQFPFLSGLIVSRMVGGITTNLLSTVFEAWVDTEYRKRGFSDADYETLMRDSVVVSNLAAIASGYLAHLLAEALGPVGPFEGAVTCTAIAFAVVFFLWTENYGTSGKGEGPTKSSLVELKDTLDTIRSDSRVLRICITQGLTMASLHIFIFLWSPVLKGFSSSVSQNQIGLDSQGEPAFGLIFGFFMTAGVIGGLSSTTVRRGVTHILSPMSQSTVPEMVTLEGEGEVRPMAVEFQGALCYFLCAMFLFIPCTLSEADSSSFSIALVSFLAYEFIVGIYCPCEGVIRSLYMPPDVRGSMMTVPRIIVNVAVALGVASTELISRQCAMGIISFLMLVSGVLQLSLISKREWESLFVRFEHAKRSSMGPIRSLSMSVIDMVHMSPTSSKGLKRCVSNIEGTSLQRDLAAAFPDIYGPKEKAE